MRDSIIAAHLLRPRRLRSFRLEVVAAVWLLLLLATDTTTTTTTEATSIAAGSVRERVRPWGLQSGPDDGNSAAAGIVFNRENGLVYVSGTTVGSGQFPSSFSLAVPNEDSSSSSPSSACFLAVIQPPRYKSDGAATTRGGHEQPSTARATTYRMGEPGSDLACLDLTWARHEQAWGDEDEQRSHLYALGMQLDFDNKTGELAVQEALISATVHSDVHIDNDIIWSMDRVETPSLIDENERTGTETHALYPVAVTTDPDNPRLWTVSQEEWVSGTGQVFGRDPIPDTTDFSAIILTQYTVQAVEPLAMEQEYKITINADEEEQGQSATTVTAMEYADRHSVLLIAGSTTGGANTIGGEPISRDDDDGREKRPHNWNGFLAKIDPDTGRVVQSRRLFGFGLNDAGATLSHDVVRDVCMDRDQSVLFLVGTTRSLLQDKDVEAHGGGAFLAKLDFETLQMQWAKQVVGDGVQGLACAVSDDGEFVYLAGDVHAAATLEAESFNRDAGTGDGTTDDVFCAKLDSDTGRVEWLSQVGSDNVDNLATNGGGLAMDLQSNPLLYGTTYGSMARTKDTETGDRHSDVFLIQLSGWDGTRLSEPILPPLPDLPDVLVVEQEAPQEERSQPAAGVAQPPVEVGAEAGDDSASIQQPRDFGTSTVLVQKPAEDGGDGTFVEQAPAVGGDDGTSVERPHVVRGDHYEPTKRPPAGTADNGTPTDSAGTNDGTRSGKDDRAESPEGDSDTERKPMTTTLEEEEEEKSHWVQPSNKATTSVITTLNDGARWTLVTGILVLCAVVGVMASMLIFFILQRQVSSRSFSSSEGVCHHKYTSDIDVTETTDSSDADFIGSDYSARLDGCAMEGHRDGLKPKPTDSV